MPEKSEVNLAAFNGGVEMKLKNKKKIFVRALPIRSFPALSEAVSDEPALVELFTGLSPEDVDALPVEDFEAILEKGKEINYPPFFRWGKRQRETVKTFAQIYADSPTQNEMSGANGANMSA